MHLTGVDRFFWAAGLAAHIVLLAVLLVRWRVVRFPFFTTFIAASILRSIVLFFVIRSGTVRTYFDVYWTLAILDEVLQFCVLYEIARHVFRPLGYWAPDVRRGSIWLLGLSLVAAAALTWLASPPIRRWQQLIVIKGGFFSAALMSELFVGMVALSVTVGLPWRTHVARIAQGLGVYSIVEILIEGGNSLYGVAGGKHLYVALAHARMGLYLCCLGYWIVTLWLEAPAPRVVPRELHAQLASLQSRVAYNLYSLRSERKQ